MTPLVIDVGGTHIKVYVRGRKPIEFDSSPRLTPKRLVQQVKARTEGWKYDRVSIGIPARIKFGRVAGEPGNLGRGWKSFNFRRAFGVPVRVINDAALQALGAYAGGRMLFLGFGTGVGSALVSNLAIVPLELGDLVFGKRLFSERVGRDGYHRVGRRRWRKIVLAKAQMLQVAFSADYVVLGGGKAGEGKLDPLPRGLRKGGNEDAFLGGVRLWNHTIEHHDRPYSKAWRVLH